MQNQEKSVITTQQITDETCQEPDTNQRYWLALNRAPGLGSRTINRLLGLTGGDPKPLFAAQHPAHKGLRQESVDYLRNPIWAPVDNDLHWLEGDNRHLITLHDDRYPTLLREIDDAPPLLFIQGDPATLNLPQIAIVGSRNPSASGRQTATDFAHFLASAGLAITSGLADGIDGAAHQGALETKGPTLAVTGTGLDRVYPAKHRELAHRIAEQGALISELPPGTPPIPANFPRRNRIISGLSLGTLVVEAAQKSGSLITARLATEQGREVFAIPGSIHNPLARGCHALIRQGAKLVETAGDILEELTPLLGTAYQSSQPIPQPDPSPRQWDSDYQQLMTALDYDPTPIDQLIQRSGLTADAVSSMLLLLELEGFVSAAPGGRYCRTDKMSTESL
ncbi:DNA-processing protein DprA [Sedimenticola selenatireducens]|uniref:DNA-protecting protein DprA n=1 Tax=Sedimenticola selenatireducens TaxID=191960 RepID=A0A558DU35_9GAMM|nr:DNA-processing protein DprA [Sedimenticola selenatireducens]TVO76960.1 DNA-protecting protein DprA [Sedimenticola selenatireducens]TVT64403.1 MAG: DNA-protecting protein DprA [Sedimenticola selenatireducens]